VLTECFAVGWIRCLLFHQPRGPHCIHRLQLEQLRADKRHPFGGGDPASTARHALPLRSRGPRQLFKVVVPTACYPTQRQWQITPGEAAGRRVTMAMTVLRGRIKSHMALANIVLLTNQHRPTPLSRALAAGIGIKRSSRHLRTVST